ncbi:hypothetical protein Ancab_038808 [Ancistrocladus abbreviatus]
MSTPKRCLYEVLGLPESCTQDEIRSAYKKLALQRHPDKLVQSGLSAEEATASFQELVRAYEVLSDPKERKWYDSHRSQILFSDPSNSNSLSPIPDLFAYFSTSCYSDYSNSKKGFYKVYSDVVDKIYANELNYARKMGLSVELVKEAPAMGDLSSPYAQANAFYGYWLGFSTVMDFAWVDKWDSAAGINRKSRRVMEEENKKMRRKARKEYNETVRGLAEFVKKRDKRVIDMMVRKEKEMEKKREEERERRKAMEKEKLERARMYEEPEWARVAEKEVEGFEEEEEEEELEGREEKKEWYCVACGKKFKSEKQWKNHEQSKKHKEKVAELRDSFADEEDVEEVEELGTDKVEHKQDEKATDKDDSDVDHNSSVSQDYFGDELEEKFRNRFVIDEPSGNELQSGDEEGINNVEHSNGVPKSAASDEEMSFFKAMLSGHKSRRAASENQPDACNSDAHVESNTEDRESMEYNNKKSNRKSRRVKRDKGRNMNGEAVGASGGDSNIPSLGATNGMQDGADPEMERSDEERSDEAGNQAYEGRYTIMKDMEAKAKNGPRGRKQKAKSKNPTPVCEKCGEEFESRNKLHKHIAETGHAALRSR